MPLAFTSFASVAALEPKWVRIISRGVSRETSSRFSPLPSHGILEGHTTRAGGAAEFRGKHGWYDKANMIRLNQPTRI